MSGVERLGPSPGADAIRWLRSHVTPPPTEAEVRVALVWFALDEPDWSGCRPEFKSWLLEAAMELMREND
jgi:hypothetical protein